jgi:hypothetical protein
VRLVRLASSRSSGGLAIWVVVLWCAFVAGAGVDAARADTPAPADTTSAAPADTTSAAPVDATGAAPADTTSAAPADTTSPAPVDATGAALAETSSLVPADTTGPAPADTTSAPADATAVPGDTLAPADTTKAPADTTPAPAETTAAPAMQAVPLVAPIVVTDAQSVKTSALVTRAPGLVRSTALPGQLAVELSLRLSGALVSRLGIAPAAAAAWPVAVVGGSRALAGFWVAQGFGPAAQRSPVRVGGLESGTASPRTRNSPGAPASHGPSEPGGTSGASTSSSVASGGSSSASGALSMILLAELGLASWALYRLLISAAGWRAEEKIPLGLRRPPAR